MIVGGTSNEKSEDKAYALSLSPSVDVPSCLESICDFPHYVQDGMAAIFDDGLPTVCGGVSTDPLKFYTECYKFNFTNAWEYSGSKHYKTLHTGGFHLFIKSYVALKHYQRHRC